MHHMHHHHRLVVATAPNNADDANANAFHNEAASLVIQSNNNNDNNKKKTFDFVLYMHIQKTGGRTLQAVLSQWFSSSTTTTTTASSSSSSAANVDNCGVPGCCTLQNYTQHGAVHQAWQDTAACGALSLELTLAQILQLQKLLLRDNTTTSTTTSTTTTTTTSTRDNWYLVTQVRSPIDRFISNAKHNMRKHRCRNNQLSQAVHALLAGDCDDIAMVVRKQTNFFVVNNDDAHHHYNHHYPSDANDSGENIYLDIQSIKDNNKNNNHNNNNQHDFWTSTVQLQKFDFIGVTHYMDANLCLLALDLGRMRYRHTNTSWARHDICPRRTSSSSSSSIHIHSTNVARERKLPNEIISTGQVWQLLTQHLALDVTTYVLTLQQFRQRLQQALDNDDDDDDDQDNNNNNNNASTRVASLQHFRPTLDMVTAELSLWSRLDAILSRTNNNNNNNHEQQELLTFLQNTTPQEKRILVPSWKVVWQ